MKISKPVSCMAFCLLMLLAWQPAVAQFAESASRADRASVVIDSKVSEQMKARGNATYLVMLDEQADLSAAYFIADRNERGRYVYNTLLDLARSSQAELLAELERRSDVSKVIPHFIVNGLHVTSGPATLDMLLANRSVASISGESGAYIPEPEVMEDAARAPEWGIDMVRAPEVWALDILGEGVVLATIDTGVQYDHPAVQAMYRGTATGNHDFNFYDPSNACSGAVCDNNGHGTHVTGSMLGDDGGANQIGVAPGATWIAAKGCESNNCSDASLLGSAEWLLAPCAFGEAPGSASCDPAQRPHVINNSWGGGGGNSWYQASVDAWRAADIIPVFSAGNSGPGSGTVGSPSDYCNVMSIGGTNSSDGMYSSSSRGPGAFAACSDKPDLSAPGQSVRSAIPTNNYATFSGTSMASPHVSGCVALMLSVAPDLDYDTIYQILIDSTVDLGDPGYDYDYGHGRMDCYEAVQLALAFAGPRGTVSGQVTELGSGEPIADVTVFVENTDPDGAPASWSTTTDASGNYSLTLAEGFRDFDFSAFAYLPHAEVNVEIIEDETTVVNVQLELAPAVEVSGIVTDFDTGWPLHARISIADVPSSPIYTNPADGSYAVSLPAGSSYDFDVDVLSGGYAGDSREVDTSAGTDLAEHFELQADLIACSAPGYIDLAPLAYAENFATDDGGFTETVASGTAMWQWGSPGEWPAACGQGSNCWGTNLGGNYPPSSDAYVTSPVISLGGFSAPLILTWDQANHIETFTWDQGRVELSIDGGAWTTIWQNPGSTVQTDWRELSHDLSAAAGQDIQLRWRLTSDGSVHHAGLYFDNIRIQGETDCVAQAGELVSGRVTDANTGDALIGADILVDDAGVGTSGESEDPALGQGAYLVFVPAGNSTMAAGFPGYELAELSDNFIPGNARRLDFELGAGQLSAVPSPVVHNVAFGYTGSSVLDLINDGSVNASFTAEVLGLVREDFETDFPPTDWVVENLGGDCVWQRNDEVGRPNYAGGEGFSAAADSDACGDGTTMDSALISPSVTVGATSTLDFVVSYRHLNSSRLDVDVSTDGDSWNTIQSYTASLSAQGPGAPQSLSLAAYSGQSIQVRFRYVGGWDWWAQVDQIEIRGMVDWLTVDPSAETVGAATLPLTLNYDAGAPSITSPGEYTASVVIENDTPYGMLVVPVTMVVVDLEPAVIGIAPMNLSASLTEGQADDQDITISNSGEVNLDWFIDDTTAGCELPGWASVNPDSGSVADGDSDLATVSFDATGLTLDVYLATLCVASNDPLTPVVEVELELTVVAPPATVEGYVFSQGYCGDNSAAAVGADILIQGQFDDYAGITDGAGFYSISLPADETPVSVTATAIDHLADSQTDVGLSTGETVDLDFNLVLEAACATVDPTSLEFYEVMIISSQDLTVGNGNGAASLTWSVASDADCYDAGVDTWLSLSSSGDTMAAGASQVVEVSVDSDGLTPDLYETVLCIATSDSEADEILVPVSFDLRSDNVFLDRFEE
jgi:subtilisin family serine protease